jgi:hypothetical protein
MFLKQRSYGKKKKEAYELVRNTVAAKAND